MDPGYQSENDIAVDVWWRQDVTFEELSPLLDRLAWRFGSVRAQRRLAPLMTGSVVAGPDMIDVVIIALVLRAGYAFTGKVFERLADDSYNAIRAWLLGFRKLSPDKQREVRQRILLEFEDRRFYIDQSISDEDFRIQLTVAQQHVNDGATAGNWYWHDESGSWRQVGS